MKHEIVAWNLQRNDLAFDPMLETKMLSEEANEFYMATSLVERLREYSDFVFVLTGTEAKFFAKQYDNHGEMAYSYEHFKALLEWAEHAKGEMWALLKEELRAESEEWDWEPFKDILKRSLKAVIEANNAKGTEKNADGKIVKGPNYVSPSEVISEILKEVQLEN